MRLNVREIREKLEMSQLEFAAAFGLNLSTLRQWEQERKSPAGPARVLLMVIERAPQVVADAIKPRAA